jgi:hypothetical protein
MRSRAVYLFAALVAQPGCSGNPAANSASNGVGTVSSHSGTVQQGAGTLVYPNVDLRVFPAKSPTTFAFAASVVGLTTVEVIREQNAIFKATPLTAPTVADCPARTPVAIAIADADLDGHPDALVFDPCGNWIALNIDSDPVVGSAWSDVLPAMTTYPFLDLLQWPDQQHIFGAADLGGSLITLSDSRWTGPETVELPIFGTQATALFAKASGLTSAGSEDILAQGHQQMAALPVSTDGTVGDPTVLKQSLQPPYLVPFDGFDALATVTDAACGTFALGVGILSPYSGSFPRTVQLLKFGQGTFGTTEIATGYDDITTIAVVPRAAEGDAMVGVYGTRGGDTIFGLWQVTQCSEATELAETPIEFDWRTPSAPGFGSNGPNVPKTNGVKIAAAVVGDGLEFVHYDGFDVRVVRASSSTGGWDLTEEKHVIHEDRQDLSFATPVPTP